MGEFSRREVRADEDKSALMAMFGYVSLRKHGRGFRSFPSLFDRLGRQGWQIYFYFTGLAAGAVDEYH